MTVEEKVDNANKVEPKFKNEQWIVWQDKCYKVNYNGCGYELVDQNGLSTSLEYETIDENAHLWDITKDAKNGDVLHCWIDGEEFVLIYKGIKDGYITTYGHLYQKFKLFSEKPTTMFCRTIQGHFTPATKEQRDLLFTKMKKAEYEWNAEKKELKKIEQNPAEWSKKDNDMLDKVIHRIEQLDHYWNKPTDEKIINRLKSLRPQNTWKPRIYISGPISGHDMEERRKAFKEIQERLETQGYEPVNPMENGLPAEATTREHMKRDIELLITCNYIYMMRRWTHSKGCKVEFDVATAIGLPVFFEESGEIIGFE